MKKILFIKKGKFSRVNAGILNQMHKHFPDYTIEVLDIGDLLFRKHPYLLVFNFFPFLLNYGLDFMRGYKNLGDVKKVMLCTPYLFRKMRQIINQKVLQGAYTFTLQTQSIHDYSTRGTPHFIYTDHTALVNHYYPDINLRKYKKSDSYLSLEPSIYTNARRVFVLGSHVARSLVEQYALPPENVRCIGAGNNVVLKEELTGKQYNQKNILFVGIEWKRKGGPLLVSAFREVLKVHPDAHLTIVGCKPKVDLPNCHVLGKIPVEEVTGYFQAATVFCMPSVREPFGIVYIEAMLFKLPVVALNIGATADFIQHGHNGYLVDKKPDEIAQVLNQLLSNPTKCRAMGERGYPIAKRFTWDQVGARLKAHIDECI